MSETGQQPSKERWDASQIPASFSLTSPSRIWGMRQSCDEPPNCHCARLPLLLCSFLSEPSGRTPALQCLPYSISAKLSLASHEKEWNFIGDQITKKKGGGFSVKRKCSKGGRKLWNKKDRGFCLLLSVAIIFGEVCGSAFLVSVSGAGEDLG